MSERLTEDEIASFEQYAQAKDTEPDGTQAQWADYTLRLIAEVRKNREFEAAEGRVNEWLQTDGVEIAKSAAQQERNRRATPTPPDDVAGLIEEARKACRCLWLEVHETIANDVERRVGAVAAALESLSGGAGGAGGSAIDHQSASR